MQGIQNIFWLLGNLIRDVCAIRLSFDGYSKFEREVKWPLNADVIVIGRNARAAGYSLWNNRGIAIAGGEKVTLLPHSFLHAASVVAGGILQSRLLLASEHHENLLGKVSSVFQNEQMRRDFENLLYVRQNRTGKRGRLGFRAVDISALPSHYSAVAVLVKSIEAGNIVVKAVPLVEGFRVVLPTPALSDYKHPEGHYASLEPSVPATIRDRLELAVGENCLTVVPVYEA